MAISSRKVKEKEKVQTQKIKEKILGSHNALDQYSPMP